MTDQQMLANLYTTSAEITEVFRLEANGIRDGDGYWHGTDVINHVLREYVPRLSVLAEQYAAARDARLLAEATTLQPAHDFDGLPF